VESRQPRQPEAGIPERPPRIDSVVFARRKEVLRGSSPLSSMRRLLSAGVGAEGLAGVDGLTGADESAGAEAGANDSAGTGEMLNWEVEGFLGRDEMQRQREFLRVRTRFSPWMTCSRCLAPVQVLDLATDTCFRLAASEAQAAAEDREEESVEVIAADPNLDLAALVEDEAILALPMAPAHASCQWMNTAGPEFPSGL